MSEIFAAADVSLVTLREGTGFGALPSKTYSIMGNSRPVIVSVDPGSDTWDLVERAKGGICLPPEAPQELAKAILYLHSNSLEAKAYGKNGRDYVIKNHSSQYASKAFVDMFSAALTKK